MMTRKDYIAFAEALRDVKLALAGFLETPRHTRREMATWQACVVRVADVLADDNPRFDRERFFDACGWEA